MLITISGMSGSGKSTASKGVSDALGIPTVDVGQIFRAMAKRYGMEVTDFGKYVERHPEIDRKLDDEMIRQARRKKNLILQGRLAGWMTYLRKLPAIRIWIGASLKVRARRVAGREGRTYAETLRQVDRRDRENRARYRRTYGLDVNDLSVYDIVVQTDNLTLEEVVSSLVKTLKVWTKNSRMKRKTKKRPSPKRLRPSKRWPKKPLRKKLPQSRSSR